MLRKLRSSPIMYRFTISADAPLYSAESFCCSGRSTHASCFVCGANGFSGEIFTSPVLAGTNGTLHVSHVFLNELEYRNLELMFENGMISDYTCTNFECDGRQNMPSTPRYGAAATPRCPSPQSLFRPRCKALRPLPANNTYRFVLAGTQELNNAFDET